MAVDGRFGLGRRLLGTAEGLGTTVVVVLLVAALVFATSRPTVRVRRDLTEGAHFTLSEQTKQVLAGLEETVEVVTVLRPEPQRIPNGLPEVQRKAGDYVRNLLEEFVLASGGRLELRHVDPYTDRAGLDELVRDFHLTRTNVVLMRRGERTEQVFLDELVTIDRGLAEPGAIVPAELRAYHGEGPLTSALLTITSDRTPRVGLLVGAGEPNQADFGDFGIGLLAESIRGQGMEVADIDLSTTAPDGLDALVLIGPTDPLDRKTVEALEAFHEQGGALLVALHPWAVDPPLDAFLERLGVLREYAILCTESGPFEGPRRAELTGHAFSTDHPVSEPIAAQGFFASFPVCGGLAPSDQVPPQVDRTSLVITEEVFGDRFPPGERSGNYVFDDGQELRNKRVVAMAVQGGPGRAVVFGGAGFLTNAFLTGGGPGNMDLGLNSLNWLVEREDAVAARPRQVFESRVDLYGEEKAQIFWYVVIYMPLGGALLGLLGWFLRRR